MFGVRVRLDSGLRLELYRVMVSVMLCLLNVCKITSRKAE